MVPISPIPCHVCMLNPSKTLLSNYITLGQVPVVEYNVDTSQKISPEIANLYNLRSVETLSQSSLNVAGVDNIIDESVLVTPSGTDIFYPLSALSKTVGVGPLKETLTQTYVAPNVTTSLVQPVHIESESASDNEKSQSKMVTANDEEEKALVPSFVGYAMDFLCTYMI